MKKDVAHTHIGDILSFYKPSHFAIYVGDLEKWSWSCINKILKRNKCTECFMLEATSTLLFLEKHMLVIEDNG